MTPHETVQFASAAGPASGVLYRPAPVKRGLVVVQEWWGLVPHIEDVARRFASLGFTTVTPDLYRGKKTLDAEEASHLMGGLDFARAGQELAGAVEHLRVKEGCTHVGLVGFCMGGALAVIGASLAKVDAYVAFYGFPPEGAATLADIKAPGLIFFGDREGFFSVPSAQAFAKAQSERGIATEVRVYPGAQHAFFNDTRPEVYSATAAADAWARTLAHLGRHLSP